MRRQEPGVPGSACWLSQLWRSGICNAELSKKQVVMVMKVMENHAGNGVGKVPWALLG